MRTPKAAPSQQSMPDRRIVTSPKPLTTQIVAITGLPGAGVGTVAKLLSSQYDALTLSMASVPKIAHRVSSGLSAHSQAGAWSLMDFRLDWERRDGFHWVRPINRRLKQLMRNGSADRIAITGILTPREVAYCRRMGARMIHLEAPETVRRQRIGLRYPNPPHPGLSILDRLVRSRPHLWDAIIDSDEPYPEFIKSLKAQLGAF